jgi:hypothetical protein
MSSTDLLFAQSAIEAIGKLEEHFLLRRSHLHINRCGGCGGPAYQQPCAICNFYPMGQDKGNYSPKVATLEHFKSAVERSGLAGSTCNLATWYFRSRFERVSVLKHMVPEAVSEASKLEMPSAEIIWDLVVKQGLSLNRERPPLHIQYGWDAVDGLNHLRTLRQMDTKLSGRISSAIETWVKAAHGDDLDATVAALDEVGLLLRNHTAHIANGNRMAALKAVGEAVENLPTVSAPSL